MNTNKNIQHGGKRQGAGRPKGRNAYGEETHPLRIPRSLVPSVKQLLGEFKQLRQSHDIADIVSLTAGDALRIPLYGSQVEAGFASPADDFVEEYLDLNQLLVHHVDATFFVRVSGHSMIEAGIQSGDILIVDRSLQAQHGKIVIAVVDAEVTVKRLHQKNGELILKAENPEYSDIPVTGDLHIWGVVTSIIHQV